MPGHHSSSSHSSSSHSSSHSHSSSSHSSSSHSSNHPHTHTDLNGNKRDNYPGKKIKIAHRMTPKGRFISRYYWGKDHEYIYFDEDWKDKKGDEYKAGYYDEDGNYCV